MKQFAVGSSSHLGWRVGRTALWPGVTGSLTQPTVVFDGLGHPVVRPGMHLGLVDLLPCRRATGREVRRHVGSGVRRADQEFGFAFGGGGPYSACDARAESISPANMPPPNPPPSRSLVDALRHRSSVPSSLRFGCLAYDLSLDLRERGIVVPCGTWRSNRLGTRRGETPTRGVVRLVVLVDLVRTLDTRHGPSSVAPNAILDTRLLKGLRTQRVPTR